MELDRIDILKKINTYSLHDNKIGLINILCELLEDKQSIHDNIDIIIMIIEIGELYGYNEFLKNNVICDRLPKLTRSNALLRKIMFTSYYDNGILFNSGQLSLLEDMKEYKKLFISAPTSFGKTSLIFEHIYTNYKNYDNICIIVPTNALEEELFYKFLIFNKKLDNYYKIFTNPHNQVHKAIFVLTPEKYLLLNENSNILFDLIVVDESYKIEDSEEDIKYSSKDILNNRSSKYRMVFELVSNCNAKLIFLSPYTYKKSESMLEFFKKYDIKFVDRTYNYVEHKIEDVSTKQKAKRVFNEKNLSFNSNLAGVKKAVEILPYLKGNTILYIRYPSELKRILPSINSDITGIIKSNERLNQFYNHLINNYTFDDSNWYVLDALKKGIGLYISPIPRYIKLELLKWFNDGVLKLLVVTTAFAEGVNSSARNIIMTNDIAGSHKKMTNLDMLNLAGRAGRFGKYSKGYVYAVKKDISEKLEEAEKTGVIISNSNYEFPKNNIRRSDYEIDIIDDQWLTDEEMRIKKLTTEEMRKYDLTSEDLKIALCTSRNTKLQLYKYFVDKIYDDTSDERYEAIKNLLSNDRKDVIESLTYIFNDLRNAKIEFYSEPGEVSAYSKSGYFLWGKFYAIHSSGNIKEILKSRKKYIVEEYKLACSNKNLSSKKVEKLLKNQDKGWIMDYITDGEIDNFKLYNNAFKFISNIIEYRIPFYIGLYVSIFKLFCKKHGKKYSFSFDIVDISNSLENKTLGEKYNNMLEFGLPLDMVKKISRNEDLDEFEKIILEDYDRIFN